MLQYLLDLAADLGAAAEVEKYLVQLLKVEKVAIVDVPGVSATFSVQTFMPVANYQSWSTYYILELFFASVEIPKESSQEVLLQLFKSGDQYDAEDVQSFVKMALEEATGVVSVEVFKSFLESREKHYESQSPEHKLRWLELLDTLYNAGLADSSTSRAFASNFSSTVEKILQSRMEVAMLSSQQEFSSSDVL